MNFAASVLGRFDRKFLRQDIFAGLTLAAIGIPEVMGYTKIIGTPVVTGLYTMFLPAIVFALLGSSRRLVVGADSATAAIVASGLMTSLLPSHPEYLAVTSLVALAAGLMLLLARVFKLGFLSNFLSQTVLVGFLTGVGLQVMLGQIPTMLRLPPPHAAGLSGIGELLRSLSGSHPPSLFISFLVLGALAGFENWWRQFPAPLLVLVLVIAASFKFDLGPRTGIEMVGAVQGGLPEFHWPVASAVSFTTLFSIAFSCFIVILAQSAATSSAYALKHGDDFDQDHDLLGLGAANLTAALSGTFVVNGSPTRTSIVDGAGGQTQFTHLTSAAVVLMVLLFLTRPLAYLPNAALASIVFVIGARLFDYRGMKDILRQSPMEFTLAALTAATVVLMGVKEGILLSLLLSILYHVRRSYKPNSDVLVKDAYGHWLASSFTAVTAAKSAPPMAAPGVIVYWFGADLFYANVNHFMSEVHTLLDAPSEEKPIWLLVLDAGAVTGIDYTAAKRVQSLQAELKRRKIRLVWAHVSVGLKRDMQRHQIFDPESLFETLHECLAKLGVA